MPSLTAADLLSAVKATAARAGLDPARFNQTHADIIGRLADFLTAEPAAPPPKRRRLPWRNGHTAPNPVPPIILCGEPGTGKTTFLYALDSVLRYRFGLPDNIAPVMVKGDGRELAVHKRRFDGRPLSLLSVKKWAELFRFFAWDTAAHGFNHSDLHAFIDGTLVPMRILFADEVEMTGYSPTIPTLAAHGLLVVGTSNQYAFPQLAQELAPPVIFQFAGDDMRMGDPADAVVRPGEAGWGLFEAAASAPEQLFEGLSYRPYANALLLDFQALIKAPFLETEWTAFLQQACTAETCILLIDDFSLERLRTNYDAIMRFVALFDAIEQVCVGVLVRHSADEPAFSREAITHMKVTIESARGIAEDVKRRTVVGIDRCTSRIGQAGFRARAALVAEGG